jgi:glycosyltransferase involved in cell wall biosynthesis
MSADLPSLISVLITVYEQSFSVALLLHALDNQEDAGPFEVIICDDGSQSSTLQASGEISNLRFALRYVWQPKEGNRAARSKNNGIRLARGSILVFLDGDILIPSDFLKLHRKAHDSSPRSLVCNPRLWLMEPVLVPTFDATAESYSTLRSKSSFTERSMQREAFRSESPWMACLGCSFSLPISDLVQFDERFVGWGPEDRELALRFWLEHDYEICYLDEIEVLHLEAYSTGRSSGNRLPIEVDQIAAYLLNMLHLANRYNNVDLDQILGSILCYEFYEELDIWKPRSRVRGSDPAKSLRSMIREQLDAIKAWARYQPFSVVGERLILPSGPKHGV